MPNEAPAAVVDGIEQRVRHDPTGATFETVVMATLGLLFDDVASVPVPRTGHRRLVARRGERGILAEIRAAPASASDALALARDAGDSGCSAALEIWSTGTEPAWDRGAIARRALREHGVIIDVVPSVRSLVAKVSMFGSVPTEETLDCVRAEVRRNRSIAPRPPILETR